VLPTFRRRSITRRAGEWEHGPPATERDGHQLHESDYDPLIQSGQMVLLDGDQEISPGIS